MLRVGLTGGIAAGKSSVSALLAARGAVIIDSDLLAREVVEPGTSGLADIIDYFGDEMLRTDGTLDRAALGRLVFADTEARGALEAIVHPRVRARAAEIEADAPDDAVVVHDIPLLVETGQTERFDAVVVVDAPTQLQLERLLDRGLTEAEARARIRAQATREERLAAADHVVVNDGSCRDLESAVDVLWRHLDNASS